VDDNDSIFKTRRVKYNAIVEEIKRRNAIGQPVLVGTVSVESSELIARMLTRERVIHNVLNAKFHQQEAEIVSRAGQKGAVTIATNMAGRGTDIKLGPGVDELGGLCVIGTERHEARRIDRQLRGRCARQGDPGASKFFISFEDDLMRNFGDSRKIAGLMTSLGMEDNEDLQHPWLDRSVETAQKRVEDRNYAIRKHTLQYDDVMNQQRTVIYSYRTEILNTENTRGEIFEVIEEIIRDQAQSLLAAEVKDPEAFLHWANSTFPLGLSPDSLDFNQPADKVAEQAIEKVREAYELKTKFEEPTAVEAIERMIILSAIDKLWQEHLYAMDGLRTSINLRAIGQKDPLIEYKQEAFKMFEELMGRIKAEVVHNVFRSASSIMAFEQFLRALPQRLIHDVPEGASAMRSENEPTPEAVPEEKKEVTLPVVRQGKKLQRNDACPVDPSKKFKNCCGASGGKTCLKA
jgi:preprotein translocase subunit SecA